MIELVRANVWLGLGRRFPEKLGVVIEVVDQTLVKIYVQQTHRSGGRTSSIMPCVS